MTRGALAAVGFIGFFAYCIAWLVVAVASDPTWWWFVPIYGDIHIFQESVWWGLFHVCTLPVLLLSSLLMGD